MRQSALKQQASQQSASKRSASKQSAKQAGIGPSAFRRLLHIPVLVLLASSSLAACSVDAPSATTTSAGSGNSGVTMRGVVGDFCPPSQATKGNC